MLGPLLKRDLWFLLSLSWLLYEVGILIAVQRATTVATNQILVKIPIELRRNVPVQDEAYRTTCYDGETRPESEVPGYNDNPGSPLLNSVR